MRAFFAKDMGSVVFPKKCRENASDTTLEGHRRQIEEYTSIVMMLGRLDEHKALQVWFGLDRLAGSFQEGEAESVQYASGMQCFDEIEANASKQIHNAVALQKGKLQERQLSLEALEARIVQNPTDEGLQELREETVELLEAEEILLAALKHNLNLWVGLIPSNNLPPIEEAEQSKVARSPSTQKLAISSPLRSIKSVAQLSFRRAKETVQETALAEAQAAGEYESPQTDSLMQREAKKVLSLAQMLRDQKEYIDFRAELLKHAKPEYM